MRWIIVLALLISVKGFSQWQNYQLTANRDTINRVDLKGLKQGEWVVRIESVRGEPGYEEEGIFVNNRKEGTWRLYNLMGDLIGIENYRWGNKDGVAQYFSMNGSLRLEQGWKALNPDKQYDTIQVEDLNTLDSYRTVIVKNEGASLKHGSWKYYDPNSGAIIRTENYVLGKAEGEQVSAVTETEKKEVAKPKEVLEFEKKNSGKKKVRYRDGSTGGL